MASSGVSTNVGNIGMPSKIPEIQRTLAGTAPIWRRRGAADRLTGVVIPWLLIAAAAAIVPPGLYHMYTGPSSNECPESMGRVPSVHVGTGNP